MRLQSFVDDRQPLWAELDDLLERARGRPERLGPGGVRRLGALYRGAAADLALARRRFAGDPVVERLEALVSRARPVVYATEARRESFGEFVSRGYWRRVRERPGLLALAAALLLVPAALAVVWALNDAGAAVGVLPEEYRSAGERRGDGDLGLSADDQAAFSSAIFTNNIQVTFLAFALGALAGLGTAFVLVYNGIILGGVAGLSFDTGTGARFVELVTPHGVLELSCIVVTAMAGLRIGAAIVDPGPRRRTVALIAEARRGVELVLGTAPWLVLAGLVEGFVTPRGVGVGGAIAVGVALAAVYWALVLWRGGPDPEEAAAGAAGRRGAPTAALAPLR